MATPNPIGERTLYEPVKVWLEQILKQKYASFHLEVTAFGHFSNVLQSQIADYRELLFAFLNEAAPDITGFVKMDSSSLREFIVAEIKAAPIKLDDIYQTRKYAELFDAKDALLLSTSEIPERITRLSRVVPSLLTLHGGYGKVTLVRFEDNGSRVTWFPEIPFK
jgi:hypothetical protein